VDKEPWPEIYMPYLQHPFWGILFSVVGNRAATVSERFAGGAKLSRQHSKVGPSRILTAGFAMESTPIGAAPCKPLSISEPIARDELGLLASYRTWIPMKSDDWPREGIGGN